MDAILGFIHSNMVVIGFIWGLAVKYVPSLKGIPNMLIPYMNGIVTLLTGLAGVGVAHASVNIFGIGDHTIFGKLTGACWSAIQSALIYEVFARHPLNKAGIQKQ